jgi:hypothetical protein
MQSLVSCYACMGAWGLGLIALQLRRPPRLNAEPQMHALICAFNASGDVSDNADNARNARPAPSPFPDLPSARATPIRSPG